MKYNQLRAEVNRLKAEIKRIRETEFTVEPGTGPGAVRISGRMEQTIRVGTPGNRWEVFEVGPAGMDVTALSGNLDITGASVSTCSAVFKHPVTPVATAPRV